MSNARQRDIGDGRDATESGCWLRGERDVWLEVDGLGNRVGVADDGARFAVAEDGTWYWLAGDQETYWVEVEPAAWEEPSLAGFVPEALTMDQLGVVYAGSELDGAFEPSYDAFGNEAGHAGYDPDNQLAEAASYPDAFGNEAGHAGYDPDNRLASAARSPDASSPDGTVPGSGNTSAAANLLDNAGLGIQALGTIVDNSAITKLAADGARAIDQQAAASWLQRLSERAAAVTSFGPELSNIGTGLALRGAGGLISLGADVWGNNLPGSANEWGSLLIKNTLTGGASALGGLGGTILGPWGSAAGFFAAGYAADEKAGEIADWLTGANRYTK